MSFFGGQSASDLFDNIRSGCAVEWLSATSVRVRKGAWHDSTGKRLLKVTSPLTVAITASGLLGLDTGNEANNTWYYVHLIGKSSDPTAISAVLSTTHNAAPTYPAGGWDIYRVLPIALRNNASGNLQEFFISAGWPERPVINWAALFPNAGAATVGVTNVLDGGSSTTYADVSLAAWVPPISLLAKVKLGVVINVLNSGSATAALRTNGKTDPLVTVRASDVHRTLEDQIFDIPTDASQIVEYNVEANGRADLAVMGFTVTELD